MHHTSINCKQLILEEARKCILNNQTLEQIAKNHGIKNKMLKKWLMSMNEEHRELRELWMDNMLKKANEEIKNIKNNFSLKNEDSRQVVAWCAERRKLNKKTRKL